MATTQKARTTVADYEGRLVSVGEALCLRGRPSTGVFLCPVCSMPVVAHAGGSDGVDHFEHAQGANPRGRCKGAPHLSVP